MDKCQRRLVGKIVTLFHGAADEAERLIRARLEKDRELSAKHEPLDLLELYYGFRRLAEQPIRRHTPLIDLLRIELRIDDGFSGKYAEPRNVFDMESMPLLFGRVSSNPIQDLH